jgi:transglutaminase-like putative cysteine protease
MRLLVLKAYAQLMLFDFYLARREFRSLRDRVHDYPTWPHPSDSIENVCTAVDTACVWYWKAALCLQRSAVTACLLKRCGLPAELVIGVQRTPFRAHAWVEVRGNVVGDTPDVRNTYAILDRC